MVYVTFTAERVPGEGAPELGGSTKVKSSLCKVMLLVSESPTGLPPLPGVMLIANPPPEGDPVAKTSIRDVL
jgi:hypothetical protein